MKFYSIVAALLLISGNIIAQEFDKNIASARSAYGSGNLEETRFNLQNALRDIDIVIGREILKQLPSSMDGKTHNQKEDNVTGMSASFAGLFVKRTYGSPEASSVEIISDSPMLAAVNSFLALPAMVTNSDPNQKVVRIEGYKALLRTNRDADNKITDYEVQLPFGKSLLMFRYQGDPGEAKVLSLVNTIPVASIIKLTE